jgi:hypothetical protein
MPRRLRRSKRVFDPIEICEAFLLTSGHGVTLLTGQPSFPTEAAAEAAWRAYRSSTWRLASDYGHPWPPAGAMHDGICGRVLSLDARRPAVVEKAARRDLEELEAFREREPRAARDIAPELEAYELRVRMALSISEEAGDAEHVSLEDCQPVLAPRVGAPT